MQSKLVRSLTVSNFTTTLCCLVVLLSSKISIVASKSNFKNALISAWICTLNRLAKRVKLIVVCSKTLYSATPCGSEALCWAHKIISNIFVRLVRNTKSMAPPFADTMHYSTNDLKECWQMLVRNGNSSLYCLIYSA